MPEASSLEMDWDVARERLKTWLALERLQYADVKWAEDGENRNRLIAKMKEEGWAPTWMNFALQYIKRAELFGADTMQGRQAMGKAIVTLTHILETAMQLHGDMPKPGMSSTDGVDPWV